MSQQPSSMKIKPEATMSIAGIWYNELGSMVEFFVNGSAVSGSYWTAVGQATGEYVLSGQINTQPSGGGQAVGWSVAWTNSSGSAHSVTSWSGQLQVGQMGQSEIVTFWLLSSEEASQNDWAATNVGQDIFTREQPTQEQIAVAQKRRRSPHPQTAARRSPA
jgi:Avidin family